MEFKTKQFVSLVQNAYTDFAYLLQNYNYKFSWAFFILLLFFLCSDTIREGIV